MLPAIQLQSRTRNSKHQDFFSSAKGFQNSPFGLLQPEAFERRIGGAETAKAVAGIDEPLRLIRGKNG